MLKKKTAWIVMGAAVGILGRVSPIQAETLSLLPTQWNFISSAFTTDSDGSGYHIFVGGTREALLEFDLSSIPSGATITSATMTMYEDRSQASGSQPVFMYRLTSSWGMGNSGAGSSGTAQANENGIGGGGGMGYAAADGDATWNYRFFNAATPSSSTAWTTAGGDFAGTASASALVGSGFPTTGQQGVGGPLLSTWSGNGLVADVQDWLNGTDANDGWLFSDFASASDDPPSGNAFGSDQPRRFISAANELDGTAGMSDDRPYLTIKYSVPEPATMCLVGMLGLPVLLRRRSRK